MEIRKYPFYQNPPVVEVIAEFTFEGSELKPPWSEAVGRTFLKRVVPDAHALEELAEQRLEFTREGPSLGQRVVHKMRARNRTNGRVVQIGSDFVACHILRQNQAYDFGNLLALVSEVLLAYHEEFQPVRLRRMGLWYVDIIEIPQRQINLEKYFNVGIKLPGTDVSVNRFDFRVLINPDADPRKILDLHMQDVKPVEADICKFRFDWHLVEDLDRQVEAAEWLGDARRQLETWFELALTQECKELFRPVQGGES